jgi:hypothetical protein
MMESLTMRKDFHMLGLILLLCLLVCSVTASVTYDHKAIVIDGQRRILISGSIHYPRSTPEVLLIPLHYLHPTCCIIIFCIPNYFFLFFCFYLFISFIYSLTLMYEPKEKTNLMHQRIVLQN